MKVTKPREWKIQSTYLERYENTIRNSSYRRNRKELDKICNQLGITQQEELYKITGDKLLQHGGMNLFRRNRHSVSWIMKSTYPEYTWMPWMFSQCPNSFWKQKESYKMYCDWLADSLGIHLQEDWFKVSRETFISTGASIILRENRSVHKILKRTYPQYDWYFWMFECTQRNNWTLAENHKQFLDWFAEDIGLLRQEDWYQVTTDNIQERGGKGLLKYYNGSMVQMLQRIYPQFEWHSWLFKFTSTSFWTPIVNQRSFLDWYANQLGIETQEQWYSVSAEEFREGEGRPLLSKYDNLYSALCKVYPEYEWHPWKFKYAHHNFWTVKSNQKFFILWLVNELGLNEVSDWCKITAAQIREAGGSGLLSMYNSSFIKALESNFPEHNWSTMISNISDEQWNVWSLLQIMLPYELYSNFKLVDEVTKSRIELDVYAPAVKLAFEYQGIQHYSSLNFSSHQLNERMQKDDAKRSFCERNGITLIEVPYWWKQHPHSLGSTILKQRPDIKLELSPFL